MQLVQTNYFHKIILYHIQVVYTVVKANYRDLINPMVPLFFQLTWKHLRKGYGCCFKNMQLLLLVFLARLMNRSIQRSKFSSTKYTGSPPSGDIQLLGYHKMPKSWTLSPLVCTCSVLVDPPRIFKT